MIRAKNVATVILGAMELPREDFTSYDHHCRIDARHSYETLNGGLF